MQAISHQQVHNETWGLSSKPHSTAVPPTHSAHCICSSRLPWAHAAKIFEAGTAPVIQRDDGRRSIWGAVLPRLADAGHHVGPFSAAWQFWPLLELGKDSLVLWTH